MGKKTVVVSAAMLLLVVAALLLTFLTVSLHAGDAEAVDTIVVLGAPTTMEGQLSRQQRWRVHAAVLEYRAGRAPRLLFSGGAAANTYVEADAMAREAIRLGVPPSAILTEREALTTLQNLGNSEQIMRTHGWNRVEVVTSPDHARRAAVLLGHTHLVWRVVVAPTPGRNPFERAAAYAQEVVATSLLRWFGPRAESAVHPVARVLQGMEHWVRQRAWEVKHHSIHWHPDSAGHVG